MIAIITLQVINIIVLIGLYAKLSDIASEYDVEDFDEWK